MPNPLARPPSLFNRVAEWNDLAAFMAPGGPDSLRLGVLYGRRPQGKSGGPASTTICASPAPVATPHW